MQLINEKIIIKKKIVPCSIGKAWWKWTSHEGLRSFFGKDNHVELRLDGAYEILFLLDQPKGLQGGEGNKIISFIPQEMLSFTWNAPPNFPEIRNHTHQTWVVVYFNAKEEKTEITLKHLGWLDGKEWDEVYDYFDKAWETVLQWMEDSCNK